MAIIDTGVDATHPAVGPIVGGCSVAEGAAAGASPADEHGHGTAVASILRRTAPAAELFAVKIAAGTEAISPSALARGIDAAVAHGAQIINVAAGTTGPRGAAEVAAACDRAERAGALVVAAESNEGEISYPAALETVIAVASDPRLHRRLDYRVDPACPRRIFAYGGHQRVAWVSPRHLFLAGSSFAAPRVSGLLALFLEHHGSMPKAELLQRVARGASERRGAAPSSRARARSIDAPSPRPPAEPPERSPAWIRRAAAYPFSKEVHSLVRFKELLPFALTGVADPVARGLVGKDAGVVAGAGPAGIVVTSRIEGTLEDADTLILGFTRALGALQGRDVGAELARRAIELNRNVYSFEAMDGPEHEPLLAEARRRGLRVAWPGVEAADLAALRDAGPPVDYGRTPVLGVFGTSPAQGKFTLQLRLRAELLGRGVRLAQIGTEHQSALFGMEDCFPIGHPRGIGLPLNDWREYFDRRYQQIVRARAPQLIVVGAQSGLVPISLTKPAHGPLTHPGLLYLMAVRADSFILTVNHLDPPALVRDHLEILRILGGGRTIALALSDRRRAVRQVLSRPQVYSEPVAEEEQVRHLAELEQRFGLPAINIARDLGPQRLSDVVLAAYAGPGPQRVEP